jgi:phage gp29-like protein
MKNHAPKNIQPNPTPPRRSAAQGVKGFFTALGGMMGKAAHPLLKNDSEQRPVSLETILLPHARTRWMTPAASGMTPAAIESILKEAMTGKSPRREQELYSLMESTWPRLLKNMSEVKDAVLGLDWNLMDADDEDAVPGAKELIERTRDGMKGDPCADGHGWRATLGALLDARARGISISEIEWEYRGGRKHRKAWLPKQTFDLPAWHYGWRTGPWGSQAAGQPENDGRLVLYPDSGTQVGIDFPPNKFLIAISKAGKGHPSGTALLRCLAWWWCSMNFSQEWLLNFAQIFGQPFRWATYDASQEGVKDDLAVMMEQMGSAAYGIGPDGTKVEWHESSKSGADNPQAYMLTLADTACDLLILGQTLTSSVGDSGSRALGEVHQSVRADIIDSAAQWLAEILNEQLIPAVIAVNMGDLDEDERLPYFQPARKDKKNIKEIAETIEIVLRSGIPLSQEEVYDALDMSKPADGEEVFRGAPAQAPPPPGEIPADAAPMIRRVLAKLPLDAREYFMARLLPEESAE